MSGLGESLKLSHTRLSSSKHAFTSMWKKIFGNSDGKLGYK